MTQVRSPAPGLRERKHERTRAALIDAAVELCLTRGYEDTTVEHIATAVEVSPRTFSRYFRSKDAVFVAVLDGISESVAVELSSLPANIGPMESMRIALGVVLTRAQRSPIQSGPGGSLSRIIRVVTSSETLRQAAINYRSPPVMEVMGRRMNVPVNDPRLGLAMSLISVTVVHAWGVMAASDIPVHPQVIAEHIDRTFAEVAEYASDLM